MRIGKALKEKWGQHKALAELFIGIAAAGILILAVLLIFFDRFFYRSSGLALGLVCAVLGSWHMERTIISTYGQDEKNAIMIMRLGAVKRVQRISSAIQMKKEDSWMKASERKIRMIRKA